MSFVKSLFCVLPEAQKNERTTVINVLPDAKKVSMPVATIRPFQIEKLDVTDDEISMVLAAKNEEILTLKARITFLEARLEGKEPGPVEPAAQFTCAAEDAPEISPLQLQLPAPVSPSGSALVETLVRNMTRNWDHSLKEKFLTPTKTPQMLAVAPSAPRNLFSSPERSEVDCALPTNSSTEEFVDVPILEASNGHVVSSPVESSVISMDNTDEYYSHMSVASSIDVTGVQNWLSTLLSDLVFTDGGCAPVNDRRITDDEFDRCSIFLKPSVTEDNLALLACLGQEIDWTRYDAESLTRSLAAPRFLSNQYVAAIDNFVDEIAQVERSARSKSFKAAVRSFLKQAGRTAMSWLNELVC